MFQYRVPLLLRSAWLMPFFLTRRALWAVLPFSAMVVFFAPSASAQHCEVTGCWTECRPVPGGRWCRNVCRRRCWNPPPPRYTAPPSHVPSYRYEPPARATASSGPGDPTPLLLIALVVLAVVLIFSTAQSAESDPNMDAQDTEVLTKKLEDAAREADERIAEFLKNARADEGGRDG